MELRNINHSAQLIAIIIINVFIVSRFEQAQLKDDKLELIILQSRCRVKCLVNMQEKDEIVSLENCLSDLRCFSCLKPCIQPDLNNRDCCLMCKNTEEEDSCKQSCETVFNMVYTRPGSCPVFSASAECYVEQCIEDNKCSEDKKCCAVREGCNKCSKAVGKLKGIPMIPAKPKINQNRGDIKIYWINKDSHNGIVLYVLFYRSCKTREDIDTIDWTINSQLIDTYKIIRDLQPGMFYQYRVLAISLNGSMGPTNNSDVFHLPYDSTPPLAPNNVHISHSSSVDNTFSVTIKWDLPENPIFRYKITYSEYPKMNNSVITKKVKGDNYEIILTKLKPNTAYVIQVQAIIKIANKRIKSNRTLIMIKNPDITSYGKSQYVRSGTSANALKPANINSVHLSEVYQLLNGSLCADISWTRPTSLFTDRSPIEKVQIRWKPSACHERVETKTITKEINIITNRTIFKLFSIQPHCNIYNVNIWPISRFNISGQIVNKTLQFKDFGELADNSDKPKKLAKGGPWDLKFSLEFDHLSGQFVKLSWQPALEDVLNYYLEYTIKGTNTFLKILPKNTLFYTMKNLLPETLYEIRISALIPQKYNYNIIVYQENSSISFKTPRNELRGNFNLKPSFIAKEVVPLKFQVSSSTAICTINLFLIFLLYSFYYIFS